MVKRSSKSRVAKRRVKSSTPTYRRKKAIANRKSAKVVIGRKKFSARVTCKGKVNLTRAGKKSFNAQKRKLKIKCRVVRKRRTVRGSPFGRTRRKGGDRRVSWL